MSVEAITEARTLLEVLLTPASVAVTGSFSSPKSIANKVANLCNATTFPSDVARWDHHNVLSGKAAISGSPELLVICSPAHTVVDLLQEAPVSVRAAIILSGGFSESGSEGGDLQRLVSMEAARRDIRLLGPNCLGVMNAASGFAATFSRAADMRNPGGRGMIISQSGGVGSMIYASALHAGRKIGAFLSTGNEADVDVAELLGGAADSPSVDYVLAHVEGVRDGHTFRRSLEKLHEAGKPIAVLKAGSSRFGERAIASHTGAVAGSDSAFDALCFATGTIRVHTFRELLACAYGFENFPSSDGNRLAILTVSGGAGVIAADSADRHGLDVPVPSQKLRSQLRDLMPSFASTGNPIDISGTARNRDELLRTCAERLLGSDEYDFVLVLTGGTRQETGDLADTLRSTTSPVATVLLGDVGPVGHDDRHAHGVLDDIDDAMIAIRSRYESAHAIPTHADHELPHFIGTSVETVDLESLERTGIDVPRSVTCSLPDDVARALRELRSPIVMKVEAPGLDHKSDIDGVRLGIRDESEARHAFHELRTIAEDQLPDYKIVCYEQIGAGIELLVSVQRDDAFGSTIVVGFGGTTVELVGSAVTMVPEIDLDTFRRQLNNLGTGRLLDHPRGITQPEVESLYALARALCSIADAVKADIVEINPVIVGDGRAVACDIVCR